MIFRKSLFRGEALDKVKAEFGYRMTISSRNSAQSFFLLCDTVKNNLKSIDIEELLYYAAKNICNEKFVEDDLTLHGLKISSEYNVESNSLPTHITFYNPSFDFWDQIKSPQFLLLEAKFFYYYFVRIPVMLNKTTFSIFGRRESIPNTREQRELTNSCIESLRSYSPHLLDTFPHVFSGESICYNLHRDYEKANSLTKWYSTVKKRDEFVYDYSWIFSGPTNPEKGLLPCFDDQPNLRLVIESILGKYFRVFWNSFRDYYSDVLVMRYLIH